MNEVRFGVVGTGNMGTQHAANLLAGKVPGAKLAAVCDIDEGRRAYCAEHFPQVPVYASYDELLGDLPHNEVNTVLIATPHYFHPVYAEEAFKHGLNVLTEKPAGVFTKAVRRMNEAAALSGKAFGIMYNQRTNPIYRKVREMIQNGELGEITRFVWIITDWYRSQSYYDSSSWRATWSGEGGGVLLNQCPHQLDLWQWMLGVPCEVRAFMKYGDGRNIEVENDVTAYVRYENGATGVFIASTHDAPGTNRLEITGDKGKLIVERNAVTFYENSVGEKEFNRTFTGGFGQPEVTVHEIEITEKETGHVGILCNFTDHVLRGTPLLAPGEEGILGLSISNAMHLSDWTGDAVNPQAIDEDLYEKLLKEKIEASDFRKQVRKQTLDTTGTY